MAYCGECGSRLVEGAKFCGECGTPVPSPRVPSQDQAEGTAGPKAAGSQREMGHPAAAGQAGDSQLDVGRAVGVIKDVAGALTNVVDAPDTPGAFVAGSWSEGPDGAMQKLVGSAAAAVASVAGSAVGTAARAVREKAAQVVGETAKSARERLGEKGASGKGPLRKGPSASTRTCPHCGNEVGAGARFCQYCGKEVPVPAVEPDPAPVPAAPTCPHCGHEVGPGAKFCRNCGREVPPATALAQPVPKPEPAVPTCPHCGQEVSPGAKFCRACGKSVG